MKRILFGLAIFLWCTSPVAALRESIPAYASLAINPNAAEWVTYSHPIGIVDLAQLSPPSPAQPLPPGITIPPVGAIGDPNEGKIGTPNIIVHQAPVPPPATIDFGSIGGQVLIWVVTVFGGAIATYITMWVRKLAAKAGIDLSQAQSDKLDAMLVNGMHAAAPAAAAKFGGEGVVQIKNATLAGMVDYAKAHGPDLLKDMGADPTDPKTVQALQARAERLIADPAVPTPAVLGGAPPAALAAGKAPA